MERKPNIVVTGILDTKGTEIKFIAERVRAAGGDATVLELSLREESGWADISLSDLLSLAGRTREDLISMVRTEAAEIIVASAATKVSQMLSQKSIDGIIAFGGSTGTSMATRIMRVLPIGIPKLMLSTMASGDVSSYVGTRDITMLYPIAEVGLNAITRPILNYAAAAIVAMASPPELPEEDIKPVIGCTMLGATTLCVLRASEYFSKSGYDVLVNHAVGSGGKSMEELIREGRIAGMLDITTHEIADYLFGGIMGAGPDRLTAAGDNDIPQVLSTGGLDMLIFGPLETVPQKFRDEAAQGVPGRALRTHNPDITIVGTTPGEAFLMGQHVAEKMNRAKGSTALTVPMRGWTAYDIAAPNTALAWPGPGAGPFWVPDVEKPEWSSRAIRFLEGIDSVLDRTRPNVIALQIDRHLNEPEFADLNANLLSEMLSGTWRKEDSKTRL